MSLSRPHIAVLLPGKVYLIRRWVHLQKVHVAVPLERNAKAPNALSKSLVLLKIPFRDSTSPI